ncbi:helix-turn-helix domain-containing protein [Streptomyces sp. NPDC050738]|uniref:helix-turn-helix domain-containing protein n=1 Tax=Streptomyces sp. NPDC050738 TaxID=3154744 RepID=UPI00342296DC
MQVRRTSASYVSVDRRRTTAAHLHVHVSTVHCRIGRIEQLTGRDLSQARDRVDLYLACALTDRPA